MNSTQQTNIDTFREMNRYDGLDEEWPSDEVYEPPRRTLANGWKKFHAARDCGRDNLAFVEKTSHKTTSSRYEYSIYCWSCGHEVPEEEILFIGGDWYNEHGWIIYGQTTDSLYLPPERVLELGPDPDRQELESALEITKIERYATRDMSAFGFPNHDWPECDICENEVPITFDDRCRMCYDGPWTDRLQNTVHSLGRMVRERINESFGHRLESHVDPLSIKGRLFENKILWRRHALENVSKLVEVKQCLKDDSDGHWEYVLTDMTHTQEWRYHEDDIADCFWDTSLYNDEHPKGVQDDRIRQVFQRVCDHSFNAVHDPDTGEVAGKQCVHCRARKPTTDWNRSQ